MTPKVYINGKLYDKADAKISVYDHGLLYGDGVFEGIRVYDGKVFRLKQHVDRLYESAQGNPSRDSDEPRADGRRDRRHPCGQQAGRLHPRGRHARARATLGLDPRKTTDPQVIIITDHISLYPQELYDHGLKIITVGDDPQSSQRRQPADQVAQLS